MFVGSVIGVYVCVCCFFVLDDDVFICLFYVGMLFCFVRMCIMIKFYILLIIGCLIGFNVVVLVEIVNFINSVDGVNCDVGIMVVKKKF